MTASATGWQPLLSMLIIFAAAMALVAYSRAPRLKWLVVGAYLLAAGRYFSWRALHTLSTDGPAATIASTVVFGAEAFGLINFLMFCYQAYAPPARREVEPLAEAELPAVDVFVTTYNEPPDLAYRTLVACRALDYPADRLAVYLLDDGNREEMRLVAERLGCRYVARPVNRGAKAGNLNNALGESSGKLIAILDVDHVPIRSFLKETVPFFRDESVAFVQTPHHFYNPDIFQRNLRCERVLQNEQELFFRVIQPGRDRFNAAFFAGSAAVFRRSSLLDIGGFQTKTITEDLHTSMVLHDRGYRSVYHDRVLSAGLTPETFGDFLKQRQRWAEGGIYLLFRHNPLLLRGLSPSQRVNYFASMFYFLHPFPRLVYLTAPLLYLFFGVAPVAAASRDMTHFYLSFYVPALISFNALSNGRRRPFWSDVYETATCLKVAVAAWRGAVKAVRGRSEQRFVVTPKAVRLDKPRYDAWAGWFPMALAFSSLAGMVVGAVRMDAGDISAGGYAMSALWASYNLLLSAAAVAAARDRPQRRAAPRFARPLECRLHEDRRTLTVNLRDVSESGLSTHSVVAFPAGTPLGVTLVDSGGTLRLQGAVVDSRPAPDGGYIVGIRFEDLSEEQRQGLIRHIFTFPGTWEDELRPPTGVLHSFVLLLTAPIRSLGLLGSGAPPRESGRAAPGKGVPLDRGGGGL